LSTHTAPDLSPARVLDPSGRPFGWRSMASAWLFSDRIRAALHVPGRATWPFEALLPASPLGIPNLLRSAALRNLAHLESRPGDLDRLPPLETSLAAKAPLRLFRLLTRKSHWQLERLVSDPFQFGRARTEPLLPSPGVHRADPFFVRVGTEHWLLFEEQVPGDRGRLRAARATENGWEVRDGEILPLPHHLSWPCTVVLEGRMFLLPESGEAGEVSLWECEEFPDRWSKGPTLLGGGIWHDPCLIRHGDLWWLFVSRGGQDPRDHSAALEVFFSPDPLRIPFRPHALNPVSLSVAGSRPAGNLFLRDGALHRPAQDGRGGYGSAVLLQRIDLLTPTEYAVTTLGRLDPPRGAHGLHTLNALADGGWVVDALR